MYDARDRLSAVWWQAAGSKEGERALAVGGAAADTRDSTEAGGTGCRDSDAAAGQRSPLGSVSLRVCVALVRTPTCAHGGSANIAF